VTARCPSQLGRPGSGDPNAIRCLRLPRYRAKTAEMGGHSDIEPEPELSDLFRGYLIEKVSRHGRWTNCGRPS
jgi:hypothetical protein